MKISKYVALMALIGIVLGVVIVYAAIPNNTLQDNWLVITNINVTGDYFYHGTNITEVIEDAVFNQTNEWGLVYGTTGDWFNYTTLTYIPVYINVHMHPLNESIAGEKLWPQVYDKAATQWQLAVYWYNGTQYSGADVLVMYYAHVDWENADGLEYIEPNQGEPPL